MRDFNVVLIVVQLAGADSSVLLQTRHLSRDSFGISLCSELLEIDVMEAFQGEREGNLIKASVLYSEF